MILCMLGCPMVAVRYQNAMNYDLIRTKQCLYVLIMLIDCYIPLKGGGNIVSTLRKSYSLSDLSESDMPNSQDEVIQFVHAFTNVS